MINYNFYMPVNLVFKENAIKEVANYVKQLNIKKVMIITDKNIEKLEFFNDITAQLDDYVVYNDILENPSYSSADECTKAIIDSKVDGIIAVGGGSVLDTAKASNAAAVYNCSVGDFIKQENQVIIDKELLPMIAIPTTSGTGSEVSFYSVLTDDLTRRKESIASNYIYPKVALLDPYVTLNLPRKVTIATGLDVLGHALEAILSKIENPICDAIAYEAIELVFNNLVEASNNPNITNKTNMTRASVLAGIAMSHCGAVLPHGLGCPLSGHFGVPHGLSVGVLQIAAIKSLKGTKNAELTKICKLINVEYNNENPEEFLIAEITSLFNSLELSMDLKEFNLTDEGIEKMVVDALAHGCTGLNQTELSAEDIKTIYYELKGV